MIISKNYRTIIIIFVNFIITDFLKCIYIQKVENEFRLQKNKYLIFYYIPF